MDTKPTLLAFNDLTSRARPHATKTPILRGDRNGWWRCRVCRNTRLPKSKTDQNANKTRKKQHTLALLAVLAARGVPSLLSLDFADGNVSSLTGRTFRSAYFLQFVPQVSQRILVGRPLGAFHHILDSRVLQAPQLGVFDGCAMIEDSSSECPTC